MKNLAKLKGIKILTTKKQKSIYGGGFGCPQVPCSNDSDCEFLNVRDPGAFASCATFAGLCIYNCASS
ncbi:MAG: hypothetical protein AAFO99_01445 [Bacteroidota bacterium]